jgi:hypothetical protein
MSLISCKVALKKGKLYSFAASFIPTFSTINSSMPICKATISSVSDNIPSYFAAYFESISQLLLSRFSFFSSLCILRSFSTIFLESNQMYSSLTSQPNSPNLYSCMFFWESMEYNLVYCPTYDIGPIRLRSLIQVN